MGKSKGMGEEKQTNQFLYLSTMLIALTPTISTPDEPCPPHSHAASKVSECEIGPFRWAGAVS